MVVVRHHFYPTPWVKEKQNQKQSFKVPYKRPNYPLCMAFALCLHGAAAVFVWFASHKAAAFYWGIFTQMLFGNLCCVIFCFLFYGSKPCKIRFLCLSRQLVKSKITRNTFAFYSGKPACQIIKIFNFADTNIAVKKKTGKFKNFSFYSSPLFKVGKLEAGL